jgi:alpha-L-rhamnosidase
VRRTELVSPVAITTSPSGRTIVDFGQNLTGRVRIRVRGEPAAQSGSGTPRSSRTASCAPLRCGVPPATDEYTLRVGDAEEWEPRFTVHGFRYAEVEGGPGELTAADLDAVVCHTT